MTETSREARFEARIQDDPATVLFADWLRDGRVAIGTRRQTRDGRWEAGELHLLEPAIAADLAAWLSPLVVEGWIDTARERGLASLRTAQELYGEEPRAGEKLALEMLREIPRDLLVRALLLLANSIGPESRRRLVRRLNSTTQGDEDAVLRRRLAEEEEGVAYAVAAAGLLDALARGEVEE